ncbi:hypothetical protein GCM10008983_03750 [Lentibacillus halophilus]|uniref:Uncharacterized protein n=1 Tax=Lentibacillus halophilus TaxID=295065 RepID=A0ABP3IWQ6_9BACI
MKRLLTISFLFLIMFMVVACSNEKNDSNIPNGYADLISDNEDFYSLLIVKKAEDGGFRNPDFLQKQDWGKAVQSIHYERLKEIKEERQELEIDSAPYFIFFDTDSIVYQTGNPKKAEEFLVNAINKHSDKQEG